MDINSIIEMIERMMPSDDATEVSVFHDGYNTACDDIIEQLRKMSEQDKNICALKTITDLQVKQVARAFWRRIYPYRNDYESELPADIPVEFFAHMATALFWIDKGRSGESKEILLQKGDL